MKRRMICALLLAALLLALTPAALAAKKAGIRFPVKVGFMLEGAEVALTPKLKGISEADVVWESSDEGVARIWNGKLEAVGAGKAVIAASGGGASAKLGLVVLPAQVSLAVGESVNLPFGGVEKYRVEDEKIASASKKGALTGLAAGQTRLMVKYGKQQLILSLTVSEGQAGAEYAGAGLTAVADGAGQVVLVERTSGSSAKLTLHERQNGAWTQVYACDAYVGKNGLGKAVAGDKKTPLGTYNLTTPFGIKDDPGANMPYTKVMEYHYWCGDSSSPYYNQLVDERVADRKHTGSDEYLIKYKGVYNYCMFIDYNVEGVAGKGSCIFLHCMGSKKDTAGCVAIPEKAMIKVIQWAKPGVKIVIREAEQGS